MISNEEEEKIEEVEDVNLEADEELGDLPAMQAKLKKLRAELQKSQKERMEYLEGWQRCKADAVNSRKDAIADGLRASGRLRDGLVEEIIPALDSFDMAVSSEAWGKVDANWRAGMENVRSQLSNALATAGFQSFGAIGEEFDPKLHEAVQEIAGEGKPGTIARVLRRGYKTSERIIRPAQVVITASPE